MSVTELPENLKGFEGLFYPVDYVSPKKPEADTLILEESLPVESLARQAQHMGRNMLRGIWRSPRTRRYGLGLSLGSAAVATGIMAAFLTPHTEATEAQPSETLIIKPDSTAAPHTRSDKSPRMTPVVDPSDIPTLFPAWSGVPAHNIEQASPKPTASASPKTSTTAHPVTSLPSWSTMYPTGNASPETPTSSAPATDTPPTDPPTMPLQTPDSPTSEPPETPPVSLSP